MYISGADMSKLFLKSIKKFKLVEKIGGITVDNASVNNTFFDELSDLLKAEGVNDFDKELQHFRCLAHIINLGAKDTLKLLKFKSSDQIEEENVDSEIYDQDADEEDPLMTSNEVTELLTKVRNVCRKIKRSSVMSDALEDFCTLLKLPFVKPILDCPTRWNSSLQMLSIYFRLKPAIKFLCDSNKDLQDNRLLDIEWDAIELMISYLEIFKQVSDLLSAEKYPTLPSAVLAVNFLIDQVEKLVFELDEKEDRSRMDEILLQAFQKGRDKILKHYRLCNWFYSAALILDPRHKVRKFSKTDWGKELERDSVKCLKTMYKKYYEKHSHSQVMDLNAPSGSGKEKKNLLDFSQIFGPDEEETWEGEFNRYLENPCAPEGTDILKWWSEHESTYVILSKIARDTLAIMATSVPVERFFSNAGQIDKPTRRSLNPETLRALLLISAWSKSDLVKEICGFEPEH